MNTSVSGVVMAALGTGGALAASVTVAGTLLSKRLSRANDAADAAQKDADAAESLSQAAVNLLRGYDLKLAAAEAKFEKAALLNETMRQQIDDVRGELRSCRDTLAQTGVALESAREELRVTKAALQAEQERNTCLVAQVLRLGGHVDG